MTELAAGVTIGLAAGISPGPLQALVVTSSLARGFGAGWRVAVAPLVTDAPIIAVGVLLASAVPGRVLNALGLVGGSVVVAMGLWMLRELQESGDGGEAGAASDVWRGAVVNALSPHPWVFWIAAGGPLLVAGWRRGSAHAAAFLLGFYVLLIGSKIVLAWVVARGRHRIGDTWRRRLIIAGSFLMMVGGAIIVWQGATGRFG